MHMVWHAARRYESTLSVPQNPARIFEQTGMEFNRQLSSAMFGAEHNVTVK